MSRRSVSRSKFPLVCVVLILLGTGTAGWETWRSWPSYGTQVAPYPSIFIWVHLSVLFLSLVPLSLGILRWHQGARADWREKGSWFPFRLAAYFLSLAVLATSVGMYFGLFGESRFFLRSFFNSAMLLGVVLWTSLFLGWPASLSYRPRGLLKLMDLVVTNIIVVALASEIVLHLVAQHSTSPLFWDEASMRSNLESWRRKPGELFFNFRLNSQGYHDEEFFRGDDSSPVVGLLADSFGLGVVPFDYNFATIAERLLQEKLKSRYQRVAVHNFGIPGIGMGEYAHLLNTEVLKYNPSLVVLCVFVGNDIWTSNPSMSRSTLQNWWIYKITSRLLAVQQQVANQTFLTKIGTVTREGEVPDYIEDASLEPPSFTDEEFLRIERQRLEVLNPTNPHTVDSFSEFFKWISYFEMQAGDKLVLVLIPDEFQVNDELYNRLVQNIPKPSVYDRNGPQAQIRKYCEARDIHFLDLLPVLRAAEAEGRTYHLADTHWNAHGNRVVGEALANYLVDLFVQR